MRSFMNLFLTSFAASGGRPTSSPDKLSSPHVPWTPRPAHDSECKLTIVQITDVYTLDNFCHLKTMLEQTRESIGDRGKVVSMLTGDFLSPYLLSSIDRGAGMMNALAKTPIDYLTWGNHEADIDHKTVCKHVQNFPGTFINTNMQDHEAMDAQVPFEIIEVTSPDGSQTKKVGLIAVLSDDPALYKHFKSPGAFGGATIRDPWETIREYQELLQSPPYNCDLIIPLQHLYVPHDHKTCQEFDFPVILSGHDHHRVDETVYGTRLLKPGQDAEYATALEICWSDAETSEPTIKARFVKCSDWEADKDLKEECDRAYDALLPLRNTELARVPSDFLPLSSANSRGSVSSMGRFICSLIRSAMNTQRGRAFNHMIDAVLLMGGNIRGGTDYPDGCYFSLEALEAEIKSNEVIGVVPMPGHILADAISETHAGDPIPGWMQYDDGITEQFYNDGRPSEVTHVGGYPIEHDRIYNVATKIADLTNGQSPTLTAYYKSHPELLPPKGNYINIQSELLEYFAKNMWRRVWEAAKSGDKSSNGVSDDYVDRFRRIDLDGDGEITVDELHIILRDLIGLSVDENKKYLAELVHGFADYYGDGTITLVDFEIFNKEMDEIYEKEILGALNDEIMESIGVMLEV